MHRATAVWVSAVLVCCSALGQQKQPKGESPARLELTMEIATTDDDGNPSALLVAIRNVGTVSVDMPVLSQGCAPDNGTHINTSWTSDDPKDGGSGSGYGCGISDLPSLNERVRNKWVRLRPGESMTYTGRVDLSMYRNKPPGTVEYWVDYTPPEATAAEAEALFEAGYIIPTQKLSTEHKTFHLN
jgi:hypothetical protein